jgi:hypothetical protein
MFKELKVIKLIVFLVLLTAIITNMNFSEFVIQQIHTDKTSYYPGDTITLYSSTNSSFPFSIATPLSNLDGKQIETITIELKDKNTPSKYILPDSINSGIYLFNQKFPLVVKTKRRAPITVIYPFMNNLLYQKLDAGNSAKNLSEISLEESSSLDIYTHGLNQLLKKTATKHRINYISDLDLDRQKIDSDLLIIYGKSLYWTEGMKNTVANFIANNGNVLLITSYAMNYVCWYDDQRNSISFSQNNKIAKIQSWKSYSSQNIPENILGVSYRNGGTSTNTSYIVSDKNHPIMENITEDSIRVNGYMYTSPSIHWNGNQPSIKNKNFYQSEILASNYTVKGKEKIKGIFLFQPDSTSGKIISLGTDNWCLKENYEKTESIQILTENCINFLLR